jgi:hypothetical protein
MAPDWLERYWESAWARARGGESGVWARGRLWNLPDLALQYHLLDGVPGIGRVQRQMRKDLRDERRRHSALQLEVAALGPRAGLATAL